MASQGVLDERLVTEIRQEVTRKIKQLGASGQTKKAIEELASLAQRGVQPDTPAATALLNACTHNGDMDLAENVFNELFVDFLEPDEVTFIVLVRGYGAKKPPNWAQIEATLNRMRSYGVPPGIATFNALLEFCARDNDVDRGTDVMDKMQADGVEPDLLTAYIVQRRRVLRRYFRKIFDQ